MFLSCFLAKFFLIFVIYRKMPLFLLVIPVFSIVYIRGVGKGGRGDFAPLDFEIFSKKRLFS